MPVTDADTFEEIGTGAKPYIVTIEAYEKQYAHWESISRGILERYRDARSQNAVGEFVIRKYNILWANVQTLQPTLYARLPKVEVERRYKDKDPVGRLACEIARRVGNYIIETTDFDQTMRSCVLDRLLPGRGTMWIEYGVEGDEIEAATPEEQLAENGGAMPEGPEVNGFQKKREWINPKYVSWKDFGHTPVRTWGEVQEVWHIVYMDRDQLIAKFGKELGDKIPLDRKPDNPKEHTDTVIPQSTIYVVWCKRSKKVYMIHKGMPDFLSESDPPQQLEGFWPTQRPLFATMTNETMVPVADFYQYQDQADDLDKVTNRIARLTDALKVVGVYNADVPALQFILHPTGAPDNVLIPVTGWTGFKEGGGLNQAVELVPLVEVATTLIQLYNARDQIIQTIYQITGISDIVRGSTDPNETLGAQQLKGQYSSTRIRDTQAEVARFSRDAARIIVETAVEMFEPTYICEMTNAWDFCPMQPQEQQMAQQMKMMGMTPPPPQSFMEAMRLLRNDKLRSFHINIETDSTIAMDDAQEKQNATEFLSAVGGFFQVAGPVVQQAPEFADVLGETLLYTARRYKAGRAMETSIEEALDKMQQRMAQPQPESPEAVKAKAEMAALQQKTQLEQQKGQIRLVHDQQKIDLERQKAADESAMEQQKFQQEVQQDDIKFRQELTQDAVKAQTQRDLERERAAVKAADV